MSTEPDCLAKLPFDPVSGDRVAHIARYKKAVAELVAFLPDTNEIIPGQTPTCTKQPCDPGSALEAEPPGKFISFYQLSKSDAYVLWSDGGPKRRDRHGRTCASENRDR